MSNSRPMGWRRELRDWMTRSASSLDDFVDIRWRALRERRGWSGEAQIQPYIGYGTRERVWLHARVLENPVPGGPSEDAGWWDNLAATYQRFASREVAGVEVEARFAGVDATTHSDEEGYVCLDLEVDPSESPTEAWGSAVLRLCDAPAESAVVAQVMIPSPGTDLGLISDVDDTILHTGATNLLHNARRTFFGNARTRLPLPGVGVLYDALLRGDRSTLAPVRPVFYVSSSPWNLHDLLEDFLELNAIPLGPILLRDLGFDEQKFLKEGHDHKLTKVRRILAAYPEQRFLLFGDSGQEDARLYAEAAREFGERIAGIFIRDVDPDVATAFDANVDRWRREAEQAGVAMHAVRDSAEAAVRLAEDGWLAPREVERVREAVDEDLARW